MIKVLENVGKEGIYLTIIKAVYTKPLVNFILNGKKFEAIPLKSGKRQEFPLSPLLVNIILEILAETKGKRKKIKGI